MSSPPTVVVLDLDRTVTRAGTFTPFLLHCTPLGLTLALRTLQGLLAVFAYGAGSGTRGSLKARLLDLSIAGASRAQVQSWSATFVRRWAQTHIRPGALLAIARHRAAGDYLVLATASFDFYAQAFAEYLGINHTIATASAWDDGGRLRAALIGENCYGAAKLAAVQTYVARFPEPRHVVAYSDHSTDLALLRWANEGVAVNPNGELRRLAPAHNLTVVNWDLI